MFFTCEENDTSNQNCEQCFFICKTKGYVRSEVTEVCEFRTKVPALGTCSLQCPCFVSALQTCNKKSFSWRVFLVEKWETPQKLEGNSLVYSLSMKRIVESWLNNRVRENKEERIEWDVSLKASFCLSFHNMLWQILAFWKDFKKTTSKMMNVSVCT